MSGESHSPRAGIGYDCHRFAPGRRLVLGGVELEYDRGLEGHSDADVVTHAIIDALLGAAGLEDIGHHFPDTDQHYRNAKSLELLRRTAEMLAQRGWSISHVDATVVIEQPAIGPMRAAMRSALARALGLDDEQVSIKATRGEGMGFVGRGEGAAALAVATITSAQ